MSRSTVRTLRLSGLVALLLGSLGAPVRAQGWIEPDLRRAPDFRVERLRSDVQITVDGATRVARVEIEEEFRNHSPVLAEGDYLYPIPAGAVFTDFSLFMGERELRGEMLPADQARGIYEEIVRRKKDPALIELVGHGVLRARVFPIEPGDTRRVILRYTQVLGRDGDLLRLRYPRLIGAPPGSGHREIVRPLPAPERGEPFTLTIRLRGASRFGTPYSPTHRLEVRERRSDELEIVHRGGAAARDFELFLPLRETLVGASLVAHAPPGEDGYFMLVISPPATAQEIQIPRDLTLVLDVSGSMSGGKLEQARDALDQLLAGLRTGDRFRLIAFSSTVRSFREGFAPAERRTLEEARDFLAGLRAEGSTNVMEALSEALAPPAEEGRLSLVVFLTDGKPTVGETQPERIADAAERLRDGERLFAFGIGHDVNTYLLDRLAASGRGAVSYVRPGDDVEHEVSSLSRKIGAPALADLAIERAPARLEDYYPSPLPDLFFGEELLLFGRYRDSGDGELVLRASRAGRPVTLRYRVELPRREPDNDFIPRLWASRKAGALTAQVRLRGADPELVEEIRQLGLRYGILTEYTSYLVEEPLMARREPAAALERARAAAVPPALASGAVAFERSDASSRLRGAAGLYETNELVEGALAGAAREGLRHVGRRLFVRRGEVWTDLQFETDMRVIAVAPFSEAYFELTRRLPALRVYFALGERLVLAGDGLAIELSESGRTRWSRGELAEVLAAFARSL